MITVLSTTDGLILFKNSFIIFIINCLLLHAMIGNNNWAHPWA